MDASLDVAARSAGKLGGDPTMARQFNDQMALDLLVQHGTLTRTQLRRLMGVSHPTALEIVKRLENAGWIGSVDAEAAPRPGPRPVVYGIVRARATVAAVRVRDDQIFAAIGDVAGGPRAGVVSARLDERDLPLQIHEAVGRACEAATLDLGLLQHVVVGLPGTIDRRTGDLGFSWDYPRWRGRLLGSLQSRFDCAVELSSGVQLVALAEGQQLDVEDRSEYALVWLGNGVALTLVIDGKPFRGASGAAGQIGYMPVPGAPVLPIAASTGGFAGDMQGLVGADALLEVANAHQLTFATTVEAVRAAVESPADPTLGAFLDDVARRIATGLAVVAAVVDPGTFVLQGETALAGGEPLAELIETHVRELSPFQARVLTGRIRDREPALEGGLLIARDRARERLWKGGSVT